MARIFIALGANLPSHAGNPEGTLRAALAQLQERGIEIVKVSRFHDTVAWPDPTDPSFINAVAEIHTSLSPQELMALMHEVEETFGRMREKKNAPRTLDLDLIDYASRADEGPPTLPHPRMHERSFVLIPLAEIAPDWHHPVTSKSIKELIAELQK